MVDEEGAIIFQNAASMAAFGLQVCRAALHYLFKQFRVAYVPGWPLCHSLHE
jgi:hypothetical protein